MGRHKEVRLMYWVILLLMVGFNVWLLYSKYNLNSKVKNLEALNTHKYPQKSIANKSITFLGSLDSKNPVTMLAFFTDKGCMSCVLSEINMLNEWHQKFPESLQVYYTGKSKNYLDKYGAKFSYQNINNPEKLFDSSIVFGNPVVLVVDSGGTVQSIHTNDLSREGSDRRRAIFYRRVISLFTAIEKVNR